MMSQHFSVPCLPPTELYAMVFKFRILGLNNEPWLFRKDGEIIFYLEESKLSMLKKLIYDTIFKLRTNNK